MVRVQNILSVDPTSNYYNYLTCNGTNRKIHWSKGGGGALQFTIHRGYLLLNFDSPFTETVICSDTTIGESSSLVITTGKYLCLSISCYFVLMYIISLAIYALIAQ